MGLAFWARFMVEFSIALRMGFKIECVLRYMQFFQRWELGLASSKACSLGRGV